MVSNLEYIIYFFLKSQLYYLRCLKRYGMSTMTLINFYRSTMEQNCFSRLVREVVGGGSKKNNHNFLKKTAGLHSLRLRTFMTLIAGGKLLIFYRVSSHPAHNLFRCLASGRCLESVWARTPRFRDSVYTQAVK